MKRNKQPPVIDEHQVIMSKIPNETILRMAMSMGLISSEKYDCLILIGESKQVEELMKELSSEERDALIATLQKLDKDGLISIT
ncbi:MAG TPA: hypothetical protein VKM55_02485 [Candidatus Lokiarchaeia archaeon]|nr:hypothetical protein [Candidatus Lokiarchaeia archaeon]